MSDLDAFRSSIAAAVDTVAAAVDVSSLAEDGARERVDGFASMGVHGIADMLTEAWEHLNRAVAGVEAAKAGIDAAAAGTTFIHVEPRTSTILAAVDGTATALDQAASSLTAAEADTDDALRFASDTEIEPTVIACATALTAIRGARAATEAARAAVTDFRHRLHMTTTASATDPGPPSDRHPIDFARPGEPTHYDPTFDYDHHREEIRRHGWECNKHGRVKARGLMYDMTGRRILHDPLKALPKGAYHAPELREPWRSDRAMKTSWHIEGGVAAYMRRTGTREMVLWLNIPPCGKKRDPSHKRCHDNISSILPEGYVLHVHVERQHGPPEYLRYDGTGEALI